MAKKSKEEVVPTVIAEEVAETGIKNITLELIKHNVTEEALKAMREEFLVLKINGIDDKEGYKLVDEKRKFVKKVRTLTTEICEKERAGAVAYQKLCIAKEKEITGHIREIEDYLQTELDVVDAEKEKIKQAKLQEEETRVQSRVSELMDMGMKLVGDNYILENLTINTLHVRMYDDFTYGGILAPVKAEYARVQELRKQEEAELKVLQEKQAADLAAMEAMRITLEVEKKRQEEKETTLKKQQEELKQATVKARTNRLFSLGMSFNGTDFVFGNTITKSKQWLDTVEDTTFESHLIQITEEINTCKAASDAEQKVLTQKREKEIAEAAVAKAKAETDAKVKKEAEDAVAKKAEEEKVAALLPDETKLITYLAHLCKVPVPEFTSPSYVEAGKSITAAIKKLCGDIYTTRPR